MTDINTAEYAYSTTTAKLVAEPTVVGAKQSFLFCIVRHSTENVNNFSRCSEK